MMRFGFSSLSILQLFAELRLKLAGNLAGIGNMYLASSRTGARQPLRSHHHQCNDGDQHQFEEANPKEAVRYQIRNDRMTVSSMAVEQ